MGMSERMSKCLPWGEAMAYLHLLYDLLQRLAFYQVELPYLLLMAVPVRLCYVQGRHDYVMKFCSSNVTVHESARGGGS